LIAIFFDLHAHNVLWKDINNQEIDHSDSQIGNISKFDYCQIHKIHKTILYFVDVKKRKYQTELVQRIRI